MYMRLFFLQVHDAPVLGFDFVCIMGYLQRVSGNQRLTVARRKNMNVKVY